MGGVVTFRKALWRAGNHRVGWSPANREYRFRGSAMFTKILIMLAILTASATAQHLAAPSAKQPDPSRSDLQRMLLNSQDLAEVTKTRWSDGEIQEWQVSGPAGQADATGCPELDTAVLAHNTGLT